MRFARLSALATATLSLTVAVAPAAWARTPTPTPTPAPTPACASTLTPFLPSTASPAPLPSPASSAGGGRLAQPGRQVEVPVGTPAPPALRTTAWLVADLDTGDVLAACNAHVPLAPASTLKVLTALALSPVVPDTTKYTARAEDAAIDGTRVGLVPGSVYTGSDLWHGLLMSSGNDCASALAQAAGGLDRAVTLMQAKARELGAADTVVANTSGLDGPGQVSSVYDLALFGRAILADQALTKLLQTRTYAFPQKGTLVPPDGKTRKTFQIQSHDRLLYNYAGATGIKNGYTTTAGGSFIGSATRGGHSYIAVVLRADTDTWRASAALLDWAFAHAAAAKPVGTLNAAPAAGGPDANPSDAVVDPSGPAGRGQAAAALGTGTASSGAGSGTPGVAAVGTFAAVAALAAGAATVLRRRWPRPKRGG